MSRPRTQITVNEPQRTDIPPVHVNQIPLANEIRNADGEIVVTNQELNLLTLGTRVLFMEYSNNVSELISAIPFNELIAMEPETRNLFILNSQAVRILILDAQISGNMLIEMHEEIRGEFFYNAASVAILINDKQISVNQLMEMQPSDRSTLVDNPNTPESERIIVHMRAHTAQETPSPRRPGY